MWKKREGEEEFHSLSRKNNQKNQFVFLRVHFRKEIKREKEFTELLKEEF